MSKTLLIYERAVPVNQERHAGWGIKTDNDYGFARDVNSMPLLAQEFRGAVREYPIVFAGVESQVMPAVLLGMREAKNLYVDESGKWDAQYIPAFARRYPYVFSSSDGGKTLTLCIDEEFSGISQDGEGERLFTDDGEQTAYLSGVVDFQKEFQSFFQRTQLFCKRLLELELLEPMQAQLKFEGGGELTIGGFQVVNRQKVKDLPAETLAQLSSTDELELIYLHLLSMQNVTDLASHIKFTSADMAATDGGAATGEAGATADPASDDASSADESSAPAVKKKARTKSNGKGQDKSAK